MSDSKRFSAWGDLCGLAAIFLIAALAAAGCAVALRGAVPALGKEALGFVSYALHLSLAVVGGTLWLRRRGGGMPRQRASWSDAPLTLLGVVMVSAASIVIEPALNLFPERYFDLLNDAVGTGGMTVLMLVVAAPLLEEWFFRGLVLGSISRRWRPFTAVMASAVLFGAVHAPILPQMVNALVIGIVLGYIRLASRSLLPVVVIHAINNGLAYIILITTGSQSTDARTLIGSDPVYWSVYAASAAILVVSMVVVARVANNKTKAKTLHEKMTDGHDR